MQNAVSNVQQHKKHRQQERGSHHSRLQLLPHLRASGMSKGSFCRTRFDPLFIPCLGHGQTMAERGGSCQGWWSLELRSRSCTAGGFHVVSPLSLIGGGRKGQTPVIWGQCHARITAQLSDQVSASSELWQRTLTFCKQPRAVNKCKRLHSIKIGAILTLVDFVFTTLHYSF